MQSSYKSYKDPEQVLKELHWCFISSLTSMEIRICCSATLELERELPSPLPKSQLKLKQVLNLLHPN